MRRSQEHQKLKRRYCVGTTPHLRYQTQSRPHGSVGGSLPREDITMSSTELSDNLTFLSALQMLERLVGKGLLTDAEAETARNDLRQRLRPTI